MIKLASFEKGIRWYCVRSKPKKERLAASNLIRQYGLDIFCPQIRFQRKTKRGNCWFQEALFPGYFFARFDLLQDKRAVAYALGVLNIPTFDGHIVPIPDDVIESLRSDMDGTEIVEAQAPLNEGDETTILEGSMKGLKVKVIKLMPATQRVAVLMEMLGCLVKTEFPLEALEHKKQHPLVLT